MGRGRNNRHRKRRREQSKRAHKEKKLACKNKKEKQSKPKFRKEAKRKMANYRDGAEYIKLAMPARFLTESRYSEYINTIKKWYEDGILTEITFFAFGKWNTRTRKRLFGIINSHGHEWTKNHLVFRLPSESNRTYMLRVLRSFDITHYAGLDKEYMKTFVMSDLYNTIRSFFWHADEKRGWAEFKDWFKRHNKVYYRLFEQGESAYQIIQTGVDANPEPQDFELEVHSSDGYTWPGT